MHKLLYASVIGMALGCGQVTPPMQEVSANVAPEPVKAPAVMPPAERVVTAFAPPPVVTAPQGTAIPVAPPIYGERAPLPKAKREDSLTLESVGAEYDQLVSEMKEAVNRETSEERVRKIYLPLIDRLKAVQERAKKPDCNLAREQAEIRDIRDTFRRQMPKPRKTLPSPKVAQ